MNLRKGGVFRRLLDVKAFKRYHINPEFGALCWGDDLDIAPETLYAETVELSAPARVAEASASYKTKRQHRPS